MLAPMMPSPMNPTCMLSSPCAGDLSCHPRARPDHPSSRSLGACGWPDPRTSPRMTSTDHLSEPQTLARGPLRRFERGHHLLGEALELLQLLALRDAHRQADRDAIEGRILPLQRLEVLDQVVGVAGEE